MVVQVWLLLGENTYLLFKSDIVNFVWKTDEAGEAESISLILVLVLYNFLSFKYFLKIWAS